MAKQDNKISKLPSRFFGMKIFLQEHYDLLKEDNFSQSKQKEVLLELFNSPLSQKVAKISNYLLLTLQFALKEKFSVEQLSCLVELASSVMEHSMEERLDLPKSFKLFKDSLVRHSLFRPPYCVLVFSLEEVKAITQFFQNTFFKHYLLYLKSFTNKVDIEINTFEMFKIDFMQVHDLQNEVDKNDVPEIREYLVDKAIGLTPQELEEIMKGDSIHQVPMAKRLEWQRLKEERLRNNKLQANLQIELDALNSRFQQKLDEQDKVFQSKLDIKAPTSAKKK